MPVNVSKPPNRPYLGGKLGKVVISDEHRFSLSKLAKNFDSFAGFERIDVRGASRSAAEASMPAFAHRWRLVERSKSWICQNQK